MRILHVDEQSGWRGGEQQASYLIRGLIARGHACVIAGRRGSPFLIRDHGGEVTARVDAPFRGEADLWSAWILARALRRFDIDLVHSHTSHALTYAILACALARRGKVVASRRVDFSPRKNAFSHWKYTRADGIVAISHRIAEVMRGFGVPESKLMVVHSGIDPARMDVEPLPREELGVPSDAPLIGNVAALVGHKDQATLIAAMPAVLSVQPQARLLIAGEGPLRGALERQIAELGVGHAVRLLGYRDDIPRLIKTLDVFVLSSSEEGLGTSVLDAMAAGIPVVATRAGGIPEMVRDNETGLLAPIGDPSAFARAVTAMLGDSALRARLARRAGKLVAEHFTYQRMVEGNEEVYRRVLGV
ncbi:MAG: glycosyltransferase [Candidatus Hydrogenedentes bacterium]|nr:glycosyltransferase [Candidatus Hydrogenedentota bacterium]